MYFLLMETWVVNGFLNKIIIVNKNLELTSLTVIQDAHDCSL